MRKMRIGIREQLGALVLISSLIGVAVVAIATWISNRHFVVNVAKSRMTLTASLKAAQLYSELTLMQSSVSSTSTRLLIQSALQRYNVQGNNTEANWVRASQDLMTAIGVTSSGLGYQASILPKNATGINGPRFLLNTTDPRILNQVKLPYQYPNGSDVYLGDDSTLGYPRMLYPNLTYSETVVNSTFNRSTATYNGQPVDGQTGLLLGPWFTNQTCSLLSITLPIQNNTFPLEVLGFLTVIMSGNLIQRMVESPEGLDQTGVTMIVGPANNTNHFAPGVTWETNDGHAPEQELIRFVVPSNNTGGRHPTHASPFHNHPFNYTQFPAAKTAITVHKGAINNAGSDISTDNEEGEKVAVGYATVGSNLTDWFVLVEQKHSEVWEPIKCLSEVLLACTFGTAGAMIIFSLPVAHYSSRAIRRLRDATRNSVMPPGADDDDHSTGSSSDRIVYKSRSLSPFAKKAGFFGILAKRRPKRVVDEKVREEAARRRAFRIPARVKERKHMVYDELTELTTTFNEMTEELTAQYERLEERVRQRTAELELSKRAAEAANESKTLFIANLSHELKTPLNGIMGMCAVCMSEKDPSKIHKSLGMIYQSGDLLLNLLTDLLTFSKNQMQHLSLDEKDFRLRDQSSQLLAIFEKQAKEKNIDLNVRYEGPIEYNMTEVGMPADKRDMGPPGSGRIKDMILWGDQYRLLQVLINLVSNSLKFTPQGGSVSVAIRCLGDTHPEKVSSARGSLKGSMTSKQSRNFSGRISRNRAHGSDASFASAQPRNMNTALEINPLDKCSSQIIASERGESPPPGRMLLFEFEVQDTGPGIPEDQQQKIFEPFVQGDLGLSKKYGGTGLGLSICSQLATLMKGSINVASEVGHGSTFVMQIPLRQIASSVESQASSNVDPQSRRGSTDTHDRKASEATSTTLGAPSSATSTLVGDSGPRLVGLSAPYFAGSKMDMAGNQMSKVERGAAGASQWGNKVRVLVAEDNKTNQEVVLRMLKLEDIFDVTVAQDGQEAFDLVKASMASKKPYNLIFMDVQMPNLNGLESTRLIRQSGYTAPIVALSAYSEDTNVRECLESGMNDFVSKPIRRPRLKQVLKTFCNPIPEEKDEDRERVSLSGADAKPKCNNAKTPASPPPITTVVSKDCEGHSSRELGKVAVKIETPNGGPAGTTIVASISTPTDSSHDYGNLAERAKENTQL